MSDQAKSDKQAVIIAVVGGDIAMLAPALKRLSNSDPSAFLVVTGDLLNTKQREQFSMVGFDRMPEVYHADGAVYGAAYTSGGFLSSRAHRAGSGLPIDEVRQAVEKARAEYEQSVLNVVQNLGNTMELLDKMLDGHSFADTKLTSLAHVDLFKGHALLVAALNPVGR